MNHTTEGLLVQTHSHRNLLCVILAELLANAFVIFLTNQDPECILLSHCGVAFAEAGLCVFCKKCKRLQSGADL